MADGFVMVLGLIILMNYSFLVIVFKLLTILDKKNKFFSLKNDVIQIHLEDQQRFNFHIKSLIKDSILEIDSFRYYKDHTTNNSRLPQYALSNIKTHQTLKRLRSHVVHCYKSEDDQLQIGLNDQITSSFKAIPESRLRIIS